ncbi:MAG: carboxypeptidase regulatory-like domain-containing protein [bacterium]|nr:carboxypeptidase regulatory-like domain-containing protein [bacterium]
MSLETSRDNAVRLSVENVSDAQREIVENPPTLELSTVEVLTGRVVTSTGTPVPALEIRLQHAAAGNTRGYSLQESRRASLEREVGLGEVQLDLVTGLDGSFRAEGLAAGHYNVRVHGSADMHPSVFGMLLTETPLPLGGFPASIVFDRHFLIVELQDGMGGAWSGGVTVPRRGDTRAPKAWPEGRARVQLVEAIVTGAGWAAKKSGRPSQVMGQSAGDGHVRFDVEPDRNYLLSVIGSGEHGFGFSGEPIPVTLGAGVISKRVSVEAQALGGFGAIDIVATARMRWSSHFLTAPSDFFGSPPGEAPKKVARPEPRPYWVDFGDAPESALQLEHGRSGVILLEAEYGNPESFHFKVPMGHYRVVAHAERERLRRGMGAGHGDASQEIVVSSPQTPLVILDIGEGGQLLIDVGGEGNVYLKLVASDERWESLRWMSRFGHGSVFANSSWPAGKATLSQPYPAGQYRLVGQREGRRYDIPVKIEDGKILSVRID